MMKLGENEYIVAAWPSMASGPGWSNMHINVLVFNREKNCHQIETIQQQGMKADEMLLFSTALASHTAFTEVVKKRFCDGKNRRKRDHRD